MNNKLTKINISNIRENKCVNKKEKKSITIKSLKIMNIIDNKKDEKLNSQLFYSTNNTLIKNINSLRIFNHFDSNKRNNSKNKNNHSLKIQRENKKNKFFIKKCLLINHENILKTTGNKLYLKPNKNNFSEKLDDNGNVEIIKNIQRNAKQRMINFHNYIKKQKYIKNNEINKTNSMETTKAVDNNLNSFRKTISIKKNPNLRLKTNFLRNNTNYRIKEIQKEIFPSLSFTVDNNYFFRKKEVKVNKKDEDKKTKLYNIKSDTLSHPYNKNGKKIHYSQRISAEKMNNTISSINKNMLLLKQK